VYAQNLLQLCAAHDPSATGEGAIQWNQLVGDIVVLLLKRLLRTSKNISWASSLIDLRIVSGFR